MKFHREYCRKIKLHRFDEYSDVASQFGNSNRNFDIKYDDNASVCLNDFYMIQ